MKKSPKKKKQDRMPKQDADGILSVYDSMAQCAGDLEIEIAALKHAKRSGCNAFDGNGRVRTKALIRFLWKQSSTGVDYGTEFKKWQAKREKIKHDKDAGYVVDRDAVDSWIQTRTAIFFGELERVFGGEFPAAAKGLSEIEIKKRSDAAIASLKQGLMKKFE